MVLDTVEKKISNVLQDVAKLALTSKSQGKRWLYGKWTEEIKTGLVKLGHENGYEASANKCKNADCKEWLFDLAWYKYDTKRRMDDLFFVMECEWGKEDDIREDFEKLLIARSRYRLMIFNGNTLEKIANSLKDRINIFKGSQKGDRYLFAGWGCNNQKYEFFQHIV
jgi:hypothetical protein